MEYKQPSDCRYPEGLGETKKDSSNRDNKLFFS